MQDTWTLDWGIKHWEVIFDIRGQKVWVGNMKEVKKNGLVCKTGCGYCVRAGGPKGALRYSSYILRDNMDIHWAIILKGLLLFPRMSQQTQWIFSLICWIRLVKTFLQEELKSQRALIPWMASTWKCEGKELLLAQSGVYCITRINVCMYWYNVAIMNEVLLLGANVNRKSNPIFPLKMYSPIKECIHSPTM